MTVRGAGELVSGRSLYQLFRPRTDHLSVISVVVGTYNAVKTCSLLFEVYELRASRKSKLERNLHWLRQLSPWVPRGWLARLFERWLILAHATPVTKQSEDCNSIADNSPVEIFLPRDSESSAKCYLLKVSSPDGVTGNAATVWLSDEADRIEGHEACVVGGSLTADLGLRAKLGYTKPIADTPVPKGVLISTTTQCNLNCVHCISRFSRTSLRRLDDKLRAAIGSWFRDGHAKSAASDYSGDILWSDFRFGGDIDFLIGLDAPYVIVTNGVHLTREVAKRLFASRLETLVVSLDAARDQTFRTIRKGAPSLHAILENMKVASEERNALQKQSIGLIINFTMMRSNLDELLDAIRLVRETGFDCITANHLEAYTADMAGESLWFEQERFNSVRKAAIALAQSEGVSLGIADEFQPCANRKGHSFCDDPWNTATILGNGDVYVCCIPGPEMLMGNLHSESMEQIWNGPRYQRFREIVNSASPPGPCNSCPRRRKVNNRQSYLLYEARGDQSAVSASMSA